MIRRAKKERPAPTAREAAITATAWATIEAASVIPRGTDDEEGARSIVHVGGRNAWVHSHEATTARLKRMFHGLPEAELRQMVRHIDSRIAMQVRNTDSARMRRAANSFARNWSGDWSNTPFADRCI